MTWTVDGRRVPVRGLGVLVAVSLALAVFVFQGAVRASAAPAPVPLSSASCPQDISEGQDSGCVTELQELLDGHGASITVDGDFGPQTLAAVRSFQSSHRLSVDGIVGPNTKSALIGEGAGAPGAVALDSSACPADIQEGQSSGCVSELQVLLNNHGAGLVVDGDFGPLTLAAVRGFQSAHGLSVDGIVGPQTKAALLGGGNTAPASIDIEAASCPADIEQGQTSGCVTELQKLLNSHGAGLTVDGDFGPLTLAAVKDYQSAHGLSVDGIVGPQTKAALTGRTPPSSPGPTGGKGNAAIVAAARKLVDTQPPIPYVWAGGHGPTPGPTRDLANCAGDSGLACEPHYENLIGYDCSGFDREVLYLAGYGDVGSGNTSLDQTLGANVPGWTPTSIGSSIVAGDIIVFSDAGPGGASTHTGIYLGSGQMAEAPQTGENLDIVSVQLRISGGDDVVAVRQMPQPSSSAPKPPTSTQSGVVDHPGTGLSTNADWARLVLQDGGWPTSVNNVTVVLEWMASENPPDKWWRGNNNPLDNGLGSGGGEGLGSYPNLHTAAYYVALNLTEGKTDYGAIVTDLKASAPVATTRQAIWDSPWAGSHYGYGADWYTANVPTVAAPASVTW